MGDGRPHGNMVTTQTQKYSFACVSSWNLPSYLLGPFAGRGRADQRVAPTGSGEDGATATSPERCKYECAVMRDVRCVPVCVHMGVRCTVSVQCVCERLALNMCGWVASFGSSAVVLGGAGLSTRCVVSRAPLVVHDHQPCLLAPLLCLCPGKSNKEVSRK